MNDASVTILPAARTQELEQFDNADLADMPPPDHSDIRELSRAKHPPIVNQFDQRWPGQPISEPRVAIVHEWFEKYAGSERVVEQMLACFPQADLFAVADFMPEHERSFLRNKAVRTSFIQRLPFSRRMFRNYLPLMPIAIQQLDLGAYDLIISSNHAVAKGVITGPDQIHISYIHSPMRYAWDLQHQYLAQSGLEKGVRGVYARWLLARLRQWDVCSAHNVDFFIANSHYIARRIKKAYRRDSVVIHPPVDVNRFRCRHDKDDFFLLACRFVPYKRADIVVESFAADRSRRLVVVGDGPDRARIHSLARGASNIEFKGSVPQTELIDLMQRARGFVFAAEEDFGIAMVEAQACGTPVIAYGRGGACDIVVPPEADHPTGLLFPRQDADAISSALTRFDTVAPSITAEACRANSLRFSQERFRSAFSGFVQTVSEPYTAAAA